MMWAIYTRHADLAPLLLGSRQPDFFEACALGRTERAARVDAADPALVNAHSPDGFTGLGFACFFRHPEVARLLLDHGANPSLASSNGLHLAPLHSAVAADSFELVDLLLARGAEPNPRNPVAPRPCTTQPATAIRDHRAPAGRGSRSDGRTTTAKRPPISRSSTAKNGPGSVYLLCF